MSQAALRARFFNSIANQVGPKPGRLLILTHLLVDRLELIEAMAKIAPIAVIVAIPYSIDLRTYDELKKRFEIICPTLEELHSKDFLLGILEKHSASGKLCVSEIGGYFAPWLNDIQLLLGERIIGFIEDTESGHRRYLQTKSLPYPTLSVARSSLKQAEDHLVGPSCIFSTEKLLRAINTHLLGKKALVLGYGKVGRGTGMELLHKGVTTMAYDVDPIRNTVALGDGILTPSRDAALRQASLIFGCTGCTSVLGEDFPKLSPGTFLISCSSRDIEFDLTGMRANYQSKNIVPGVELYINSNHHRIHLLGGGLPINFLDGAIIGPPLALVQGELLYGIGTLMSEQIFCSGGIQEVSTPIRQLIAITWQQIFCDSTTGAYIH